ncbi:hypothetical protein LTR36_010321 [Oleoguttula mirabilis]|uniref:Fe2OG dioxygenase domain-containing protein n=1 Tax=Oleoguttula mirabilis TaxID=1507867 RepID=A0AAV9J4I1_9PEZI|nr:hypothetical protein LTR36_010321 [Oleoguttula mirabilis]
MAPGALLPDPEPEYVTFHAAKGKLSRPVLKGEAKKQTFETIPQVDFAKMRSDSIKDRKAVALEVGEAFRNVGFLYATNHGISEDLQARTFKVAKEFFALPTEEKMKIHLNKSPAIKGYERLLETRLDDTTRGDNKEAVNIGDDPYDPDHRCPEDFDTSYYPSKSDCTAGLTNQWPANPVEFRATMNEYRSAVSDFAKRLLSIIALSLDLPENYFDYMTRFPMAGLRPLHYPPQEVPSDVGIGAHADYSWFTLVWQMTSTPGLEVLNHNGCWVAAPPVPNTLVVNVTDRPKKYVDVNAGAWQRERLYRARYKHPASIAARERGEI